MLETVEYMAQVMIRVVVIAFLVGLTGGIVAMAYMGWRERPWKKEMEDG